MVEYTESTGDTLDFTGATEYTEPTGDTLDFEVRIAETVQLPGRSLTLGRTPPTATGAGTASTTLPSRSLSLGRTVPSASILASLPARTVTLARTPPTATGAGTVSAQLQSRALTLTRGQIRAGSPNWTLDTADVTTPTDERATHAVLSLTFRADDTELADVLRPLKPDEGQVTRLPSDDGGFTAVDRAGGANTFDLTPPITREPLRQDRTVHVDRYEESMVTPEADEWDVELDLVFNSERTDTPSISETRDTGEWAFETRFGQIATPRVDAEFVGVGENGVAQFDLTARFDFAQARVFEAAFARLEAARIKEVPDGQNRARDESDDNAATVTVTSPATDDVVADGEYVVLSFESERLTDAYQSVTFRIATKSV